jgi:hypothetical protein
MLWSVLLKATLTLQVKQVILPIINVLGIVNRKINMHITVSINLEEDVLHSVYCLCEEMGAIRTRVAILGQ